MNIQYATLDLCLVFALKSSGKKESTITNASTMRECEQATRTAKMTKVSQMYLCKI